MDDMLAAHACAKCVLCDKELLERSGIFIHLSRVHFRNDQNGTKDGREEPKIVKSAILKCEKCSRYFMENNENKANSSKLCKICSPLQPFVVPLHMGIRENPEKKSFDPEEEEVIDVPSEDHDSSDDNFDYLDGKFILISKNHVQKLTKAHYSKSQIFVQKFNFDNPPNIFTSFLR